MARASMVSPLGGKIMKFLPVMERHEKAVIILGGESLRGFDFNSIPVDVPIVTCNFVADHIPRFDYWVSIDTNRPKKWLAGRPKGPKYFYGIPSHATWLPKDVHGLRRMPRGPLCDDPREIVSGSSGYAALNLVYHFQCRLVVILGLDGDGGHFYDANEPLIEAGHKDPQGYHDSFPALFAMARRQLDARRCVVMNASMKSRVDCFDKVPIGGALQCLK